MWVGATHESAVAFNISKSFTYEWGVELCINQSKIENHIFTKIHTILVVSICTYMVRLEVDFNIVGRKKK